MEQLNIDSYIFAIDSKNKNNIESLFRSNSENNKDDKNEIIIELYNNNLLTVDRLQFIMNYCTQCLNISSNLIKRLVKKRRVTLLDIIFNSLKIYDNAFIL